MPSPSSLGSPREGARAKVLHTASPLKTQMQQRQSLAFKAWAQGRCYRCLASDHQVRDCQDYFRCIRCRRPGHKERQCRFRSPATPSFRSPATRSRYSKHSQSWAEVVATPPSERHGVLLSAAVAASPMQENSLPALQPIGSHVKNDNHVCSNCCCASMVSMPSDLQSPLVPMVESLQSDLRHLIEVRLEEMMRPLREEASTIKLWLARIANHLECGQPSADIPDVTELFGPCSPVRHSQTSSILPSLAAACRPADCSLHRDTCEEIIDELTTEVALEPCDTEFHQKTPLEQATEVTLGTPFVQVADQTLLQTVNSIEDVVLIEDASDDEISETQMTVKDPIFLVTIEDCAPNSAVEVINTEHPKVRHEDPPIGAMSAPVATPMKDEDLACSSMHPPSPLSTRTRRRRKSYDRSSLRRSTRLAQRGVLKDLGIVGNDGKLNEDVVQIYAERLKNLVPPDLLKSLMELKGRAFWDMVAEVSLSLL